MLDIGSMVEAASHNQFLVDIALLLLAASIGGWLASLVKMPAVLGQIVIGIIIGPTLFNLVNSQEEIVKVMAELGVIFLMFLAGLETDLKELKSVGKGASIIAMGGIIFPMLFGAIVPFYFFGQYLPAGDSQHRMLFALYIGAILSATSVSIAVSVLRDMKQLASRQGISILGAAIIDDVLGIIVLAIITGLVSPSGNVSIPELILRIIIFFIGTFLLGALISKILTRYSQVAAWKERIITIAIIVCFFLAFSSEMFSVAAITGAYAAGVIFAATPYRHRVVNSIQGIAYALFTPIFFVSIGLQAELTSEIFQYLGYAIVLVITTILAKIIGCGLGAKISNFSTKHSLQIGVGMIARAEVALILAAQGLSRDIITSPTFTSIVLVVIISTLVTPPLLKVLFKGEEQVGLDYQND